MLVYNTKRELVDSAKRDFGCGSIYTSTQNKDRYGSKPIHVYSATTKDACKILKQLIPYLRIKKKQAQVAVNYQNNKKTYRGRNLDGSYRRTPQIELDWREECFQEMRRLNKG